MQKANVKLFVVKQNRLNSTIQLLKTNKKRGRFGNPKNGFLKCFLGTDLKVIMILMNGEEQ